MAENKAQPTEYEVSCPKLESQPNCAVERESSMDLENTTSTHGRSDRGGSEVGKFRGRTRRTGWAAVEMPGNDTTSKNSTDWWPSRRLRRAPFGHKSGQLRNVIFWMAAG